MPGQLYPDSWRAGGHEGDEARDGAGRAHRVLIRRMAPGQAAQRPGSFLLRWHRAILGTLRNTGGLH